MCGHVEDVFLLLCYPVLCQVDYWFGRPGTVRFTILKKLKLLLGILLYRFLFIKHRILKNIFQD